MGLENWVEGLRKFIPFWTRTRNYEDVVEIDLNKIGEQIELDKPNELNYDQFAALIASYYSHMMLLERKGYEITAKKEEEGRKITRFVGPSRFYVELDDGDNDILQ